MAAEALDDRALFDALLDGIDAADPVVRMRCGDAAEKVSVRRPDWLLPHRARLLDLLAREKQPEVRWHLAPMVARVPWSADERGRVSAKLSEYLADASAIVRVQAMQALADLALDDAERIRSLLPTLRGFTNAGPPSVRARARKLVAALERSVSLGRTAHRAREPAR